MRPIRPLAPIFASVAVVAGWWTVAHNGGQGWVQAVGDLVFATLLLGVVGPAAHLAFRRPTVISSGADGQAGQPTEVSLFSRRRIRVRPLDPPGDERFVGPSGRGGTGSPLTLRPDHRGVYLSLKVQLSSAAPFGVQWWARTVTLALPAPLWIAPRPGPPLAVPPDELPGGPTRPDRPGPEGGTRSLRPYRPGDQRRHVHWPASAHTGAIMVRELERPVGSPLHLTVDLPADGDDAERAAEQAYGTVLALLDLDRPLILETLEQDGPVTAAVADRRSAGRRLAAARSGRAPTGPPRR